MWTLVAVLLFVECLEQSLAPGSAADVFQVLYPPCGLLVPSAAPYVLIQTHDTI